MEDTTNSPKKAGKVLEGVKLPTKVKLSALWTVVMLCFIEGDFTTFFPPGGYIQQSLAGKWGLFR